MVIASCKFMLEVDFSLDELDEDESDQEEKKSELRRVNNATSQLLANCI